MAMNDTLNLRQLLTPANLRSLAARPDGVLL